ncbi:EamA family transporter [Arthrobacter antibioticus]|uniref:EamA family transporter n=1 Tax=Arthrobacter sp. H35-MC1 TaxID=3046203 RepID=UPI0024BA8454|nr:EamA family transporter [Arthrobacter sp. H35-MC1]MDJ0316403.1 EamA family transporter [Arthrobacter sp. H35-MC1]
MLSKNLGLVIVTSLAPILWGTTYLTTTLLLPEGRPLLAGVLRALPAGLLLLALARRLPQGSWWWKSWILGMLNIGMFFALLFVAAYRLPGGVAAIVGGIQPLLVALLASRVLHEKLTPRRLVAGATGVFGVALIVLQSQVRLDGLGLAAAVGGTASMAAGTVLAKKWGQPSSRSGQPESALTTTAWQLLAGGISLTLLMLAYEGLPTQPLSVPNMIGYLYLTLMGTALAYFCWFRGLSKLPAGSAAFLGLLSPVVAIVLGWLLVGQSLNLWQILGILVVLVSIVAGISRKGSQHVTSKFRARRQEFSAAQGGRGRRRSDR